MLRVYDELRRPRSQKIWDQSFSGGAIRDAAGPSGFTKEGVTRDLTGSLNYINSYRIGDDAREAEETLKARGIYS